MSIRNVYDVICSYGCIMKAEKDCAAGKHYDPEVMAFRSNYEENLYDIVHGLREGVVPPTAYRHFYVYEPKIRKVIYIDYVSKIIQRAIYNVINPRLKDCFIADTYSCIEGRGQLTAMQHLQKWLKYTAASGKKWYYYKLDVEKFFYRMSHEVLMEILNKKIGDKRTVALIGHYINDSPIPFGLPLGIKSPKIPHSEMLWDVGIPIGGGMSHMLANMYMDVLDQECKRNLRIPYYTRYMDDVIILWHDKEQLHQWRDYIEKFIHDRLRLTLNKRTVLRPISQGIEYVGYRIWPNYVTIRKSTTLRMKRNLKRKALAYRDYRISFEEAHQTVMSYKAMLKYCDCTELNASIWRNFVLTHNTDNEVDPWTEINQSWSY